MRGAWRVAAGALFMAMGCAPEVAAKPQGVGDRENLGDAPPQGAPVLETDPRFVPTTDQLQPPPTGPSAGTTPNVSPGKNDAPSPEVDTGGYKAPGTPTPGAPASVPLRRPGDPARTREAAFATAKGTSLEGSATLTEFEGGVRVTVRVSGAKPGAHGLHVHQKSDCSDIPGKSMAEHFAPEGHAHGLPGAPERHMGDLGNLQVAQDGTGVLDITIPRANLRPGDPHSLLGRAVVIHEAEDKGVGPSGNSGTPTACAPVANE